MLRLCAQGEPDKVIAAKTGYSADYVNRLLRRVCARLGAVNRPNAVYLAMKRGIDIGSS